MKCLEASFHCFQGFPFQMKRETNDLLQAETIWVHSAHLPLKEQIWRHYFALLPATEFLIKELRWRIELEPFTPIGLLCFITGLMATCQTGVFLKFV